MADGYHHSTSQTARRPMDSQAALSAPALLTVGPLSSHRGSLPFWRESLIDGTSSTCRLQRIYM